MAMMCTHCTDSVAKIVRRYKGHEYRLCKGCMTDFITHEEDGKIVIDDEYKHRSQVIFKKGE